MLKTLLVVSGVALLSALLVVSGVALLKTLLEVTGAALLKTLLEVTGAALLKTLLEVTGAAFPTRVLLAPALEAIALEADALVVSGLALLATMACFVAARLLIKDFFSIFSLPARFADALHIAAVVPNPPSFASR